MTNAAAGYADFNPLDMRICDRAADALARRVKKLKERLPPFDPKELQQAENARQRVNILWETVKRPFRWQTPQDIVRMNDLMRESRGIGVSDELLPSVNRLTTQARTQETLIYPKGGRDRIHVIDTFPDGSPQVRIEFMSRFDHLWEFMGNNATWRQTHHSCKSLTQTRKTAQILADIGVTTLKTDRPGSARGKRNLYIAAYEVGIANIKSGTFLLDPRRSEQLDRTVRRSLLKELDILLDEETTVGPVKEALKEIRNIVEHQHLNHQIAHQIRVYVRQHNDEKLGPQYVTAALNYARNPRPEEIVFQRASQAVPRNLLFNRRATQPNTSGNGTAQNSTSPSRRGPSPSGR